MAAKKWPLMIESEKNMLFGKGCETDVKALLQPVEKTMIDRQRPRTSLRWFAGKVLRHKA